MKHIKKKYRNENILTDENINYANNNFHTFKKEDISSIKNIPKDHKAFLLFDTKKVVECYSYKRNGKLYLVPEPDPVLIYFNNAYFNYKWLLENNEKLFKELSSEIMTEGVSNQLYTHFGVCMGFITSLFISLEAFINSIIRDSYIYSDQKKNRTESYDKDQIQRHLSFDLKWKKILTEITGKDFHKKYPQKWAHLMNLKDFRDAIVHTKAMNDGLTPYEYLWKKSFNFKYEETIHAVRDYINFYSPNYVEECNCGKDI